MTAPELSTARLRGLRTAIPVAMALILTGAMAGGFAIGRASAEPQTPAACTAALDTSEDLTEALLDTLRVTHTAMSAVLAGDDAETNALTAELAALDPQVEGHMNDYWRESGACRTGETL